MAGSVFGDVGACQDLLSGITVCQVSPFACLKAQIEKRTKFHGLCTRMTRRPYRDQKRRVRLAW